MEDQLSRSAAFVGGVDVVRLRVQRMHACKNASKLVFKV